MEMLCKRFLQLGNDKGKSIWVLYICKIFFSKNLPWELKASLRTLLNGTGYFNKKYITVTNISHHLFFFLLQVIVILGIILFIMNFQLLHQEFTINLILIFFSGRNAKKPLRIKLCQQTKNYFVALVTNFVSTGRLKEMNSQSYPIIVTWHQ